MGNTKPKPDLCVLAALQCKEQMMVSLLKEMPDGMTNIYIYLLIKWESPVSLKFSLNLYVVCMSPAVHLTARDQEVSFWNLILK